MANTHTEARASRAPRTADWNSRFEDGLSIVAVRIPGGFKPRRQFEAIVRSKLGGLYSRYGEDVGSSACWAFAAAFADGKVQTSARGYAARVFSNKADSALREYGKTFSDESLYAEDRAGRSTAERLEDDAQLTRPEMAFDRGERVRLVAQIIAEMNHDRAPYRALALRVALDFDVEAIKAHISRTGQTWPGHREAYRAAKAHVEAELVARS